MSKHSDSSAAGPCCLLLLAGAAIFWLVSTVQGFLLQRTHAAFIKESDMMETLGAVLAQSQVLQLHLAPDAAEDPRMVPDAIANLKKAECWPARPATPGGYRTCSFQTAVMGPGNPDPDSRVFALGKDKKHAFKNPFTWGEVQVQFNLAKQCKGACNELAISSLSVDLHAKRTWGEVASDVAESIIYTVVGNIISFTVTALFDALFDTKTEAPVVVAGVHNSALLRVGYVITQDGDGDGSAANAAGWNHIAVELPQLVLDTNVMSLSSDSMGNGYSSSESRRLTAGQQAVLGDGSRRLPAKRMPPAPAAAQPTAGAAQGSKAEL